MKSKPNCYDCVHRRDILGDAHSRCNNLVATVKGNKHGIENGWFNWPVNFDPVWLVSCSGFSDNPNDNISNHLDPLIELLSYFRR